MYTDADGSFYPYAVFDSQLCRFDRYSLYCYDGTMGVDLANAAAIVGGDRRDYFYYSNALGEKEGDGLWYASGLDSSYPTFHDLTLPVNSDLFSSTVVDFAPATEDSGSDDIIADGVAGATYVREAASGRAPSASHSPQIIGMMYDFKLFIARLGDDGAPEAYAIVQGTGVGLDPIERLFGAAWYLDAGDFDGVFFAGNGAEDLHAPSFPAPSRAPSAAPTAARSYVIEFLMPKWMFTSANCDAYLSSDAVTFANGQTVDGAALDAVLGGTAGAEFGDALCAGFANVSANATGLNATGLNATGANQGSKRERNSQLQRLISRPISTRANATTAAPSAVDGRRLGGRRRLASCAYDESVTTVVALDIDADDVALEAAGGDDAAPDWAASCGEPLYDLDLDGGDVLANNLGGRGPGNGTSETLRYGSVTRKDGRAVDLVLSVAPGSTYAVADDFADYQGRAGAFGQAARDAYFPIDPAARAVSLAFGAPTASFEVHYAIPCVDCYLAATAGFDGGRSFLFGGASRALCALPSAAPTPPPTPGPAYVVVATVDVAGVGVATARAYAGVFLDALAASGVARDGVTFAARRQRLGGRRLDDGGGVVATFTVEAETYAAADGDRAAVEALTYDDRRGAPGAARRGAASVRGRGDDGHRRRGVGRLHGGAASAFSTAPTAAPRAPAAAAGPAGRRVRSARGAAPLVVAAVALVALAGALLTSKAHADIDPPALRRVQGARGRRRRPRRVAAESIERSRREAPAPPLAGVLFCATEAESNLVRLLERRAPRARVTSG
ncbi:hypothetical protein JL722_644 [Aureococcus anophagefferens]|nr:hypothetical protein JL722_644 [Aureococcus anophagefferens]